MHYIYSHWFVLGLINHLDFECTTVTKDLLLFFIWHATAGFEKFRPWLEHKVKIPLIERKNDFIFLFVVRGILSQAPIMIKEFSRDFLTSAQLQSEVLEPSRLRALFRLSAISSYSCRALRICIVRMPPVLSCRCDFRYTFTGITMDQRFPDFVGYHGISQKPLYTIISFF